MCWKFRTHSKGFLSTKTLPENLPFALFDHERVQRNLFLLSQTNSIREEISKLPDVVIRFSLEETEDDYRGSSTEIFVRVFTEELQEATFSLFAILASAYVNNPGPDRKEDEEPVLLPRCIALPLTQLATKLRRLPIWDYAGQVLSNYKLIDESKPISLENITILRTLTNLQCEIWFYKIHVVIEAYGGEAIEEIIKACEVADECNRKFTRYKSDFSALSELILFCEQLGDRLETIAACVQLMKLTFSRMSEKCKDKDFFVTLRPWLKGWPKQGVIYEGVSEEPRFYGGGSGAQSSLLPSLDAFYGVSFMHKMKKTSSEVEQKGMKEFIENLKRFRLHMPKNHVNFLQSLEEKPSFRNFFSLCNEVVNAFFPSKKVTDVEKYIPMEQMSGQYTSSDTNAKGPQTKSTSTSELENVLIKNSGSNLDENVPLFLRERQRAEVARLERAVLDLKGSYNYSIESMLSFRRMHVGFATMYITRQAKKLAEKTAKTEEEKIKLKEKAKLGTGGSSFAKHFMSHIKDTRECLFKIEGKPRNEFEVDVELIQDDSRQEGMRKLEGLKEQINLVKELRKLADKEKEEEAY